MKKLAYILSMIAILTVPVTHARDIGPGAVQIFGGANLTSSSIETDVNGSETDVDRSRLEVDVVYYAGRNVGVGISFFSETEDDGDVEITTDAFGPAIIINLPIEENASFQLLGTYLVVFDSELTDNFGSIEADGDGFVIGGDLLWFFTESAAFNFGVRITETTSEVDGFSAEIEQSGTAFGVGVTIVVD